MSPPEATNWISSTLTASKSSPWPAARDARLACIFSRFSLFFSPGSSLPLLAPLTALRCFRLALELRPEVTESNLEHKKCCADAGPYVDSSATACQLLSKHSLLL